MCSPLSSSPVFFIIEDFLFMFITSFIFAILIAPISLSPNWFKLSLSNANLNSKRRTRWIIVSISGSQLIALFFLSLSLVARFNDRTSIVKATMEQRAREIKNSWQKTTKIDFDLLDRDIFFVSFRDEVLFKDSCMLALWGLGKQSENDHLLESRIDTLLDMHNNKTERKRDTHTHKENLNSHLQEWVKWRRGEKWAHAHEGKRNQFKKALDLRQC